jgi:hypothetical protein
MGNQINWSHPLSDGLVGCWLMNEGGGMAIYDSTKNGYDGAAVGATGEISWAGGKHGQAIDFVGDTKAAFQFTEIQFSATDAWTILWGCKTDDEDQEGVLLGQYDTVNNYIYMRGNASHYIRVNTHTGGSKDFTGVGSQTGGTFVVCAVTADGGGNLSLYLNGTHFETKTGETTSFRLDSIGNGYNSDTFTYDGRMDYVYVYNRDLTAGEIAHLYREPFCFMKRARPELYVTAAAPTGAPQVIMIMSAIPLFVIFGLAAGFAWTRRRAA